MTAAKVHTERVADIPLLIRQQQKMGFAELRLPVSLYEDLVAAVQQNSIIVQNLIEPERNVRSIAIRYFTPQRIKRKETPEGDYFAICRPLRQVPSICSARHPRSTFTLCITKNGVLCYKNAKIAPRTSYVTDWITDYDQDAGAARPADPGSL